MYSIHIAVEQGVSVEQPHLTISSNFDGKTLTFGSSVSCVTEIKHLHRSSRSYANSAGSSAGGFELRVDL